MVIRPPPTRVSGSGGGCPCPPVSTTARPCGLPLSRSAGWEMREGDRGGEGPACLPHPLVTSFTCLGPRVPGRCARLGRCMSCVGRFRPGAFVCLTLFWRNHLAGAVLPRPADDGGRHHPGDRDPLRLLSPGRPAGRPRQDLDHRVGHAAPRPLPQADLRRLLPHRHRLHRVRRRGRVPLSVGTHSARRRMAALLGRHGLRVPHPGQLRLHLAQGRARPRTPARAPRQGGSARRLRNDFSGRHDGRPLMSVSEPQVETPALPADVKEKIAELRTRYPTTEAVLLPALHLAQAAWGGWLPDEAIAAVAAELQLPVSKVYGVVTFYDLYHQKPVGRHRIRVCTNLSCQLRGAYEIMEVMKQERGVDEDEVTPDGRASYVHFECLGSCDTAPMMMLDDDYHENLTPAKTREILKGLK